MIQRVVTGLGILAAGIMFWFALSGRTVPLEEVAERLRGRSAQLQEQFRPGFRVDLGWKRRMAVAYAVGARIRAFEEVEGEAESEINAALNRRLSGFPGDGQPAFSGADRDLILGQVNLRLGVDEYHRLGGKELEAANRRERPFLNFDALCGYLGLAMSQAADRGDEEGLVAGFEALTQLSCDLFADSDSILHLAGAMAMSSALESVWAIERIAADLQSPEEYEATKPLAMAKLLSVVRSPAGRQRLLAAIEKVEAQLPPLRDVLISWYLQGYVVTAESIEASYGSEGRVPREKADGVEALILWQDRVLSAIDEPGFTASQASVADLDAQMDHLPLDAQALASPVWSSIQSFVEIKGELARARRWIAAGKVD